MAALRAKSSPQVFQKPAHKPLLKVVSGTARLLGYARISNDDQHIEMQLTALRAAGVTEGCMFSEQISAVNAKRPQFHLMMKFVEPGDTIVTYAFNRLARDVKFLLTFVDDMKAFGVTLRSTTEPHIDPFTTNGQMILSLTGAVDENERLRIRDRTRDGMQEKKRQGMFLGRRKMFDDKQAAAVKRDRKFMTAAACAKKYKCSTATIEKYAS